MHAEPPLHTPKSWREFALHVAMIVVSVLVALGIEEGVQWLHNRSNAAKARLQIEAELRNNLKDTRSALAANQARLQQLVAWKARLADAVRGGPPAVTPPLGAREGDGPPALAVGWPTLAHEAWDVALANRAVAYLPADVQQRFSAAYSVQRDATAVNQQATSVLLGGGQGLNTVVDLELGRAQPVDLLRLVTHAIAVQSTVQSVLRQTEEQLARSLGEASAPTH